MLSQNSLFIEGEKQREAMRRLLTQNNTQQYEGAKVFFENNEGLQNAITEQVLPAITIFNRADGTIGTGFYQHPTWLVTNAHVTPSADHLRALHLSDWQNNVMPLQVGRSFHRPYDRPDMPDLVLINIADTASEIHPSLPVMFSDNEGLNKTHTFYIDHNLEIKALLKISSEGSYPLIYQCLDGSSPLPGVSGSPILEARVIIGKTRRWEFRTIGALYARCSSAESSLIANSTFTSTSTTPSMQVCAIPITQDFDQLLIALNALDQAKREHALANASATFSDKKGQEDVIKYASAAKASEQIAATGFYEYFHGESPLSIALPIGLEPLFGDGVVNIEESLMIRTRLQAAIGKKYRDQKYESMFRIVPDISKNQLIISYQKFLREIGEIASLDFKVDNNLIISQDGLFRIDCAGGDAYWKLELQDNTDTEQKINGKPVSSIFAIVKFQKRITTISGEKLTLLLQQGQCDRTEKFEGITPLIAPLPKNATKNNQHKVKR